MAAWRFAVLAPFIFWVGGFTFYTAVVVPLGTEQLGRDGQGFITREVTKRINLAAAVSLALLFADLFVTRGTVRTRAALWLLMAACQAALFWLHAYLDTHLDPETHHVRARPSFYQWHRLYLWLHTVQWAAALISLGLLVIAWGRPSVGGSTGGSSGGGAG